MRIRAGVVIIRDRKVALIERRRAGRHYWVIPGGGVESEETVAKAALREAAEELGVPVRLGPLLVRLETTDADRRLGLHYYFLASTNSADIHFVGPETKGSSSSGTYEAVWVPIEDLAFKDVWPAEVATLIAEHQSGTWPTGLRAPTARPAEGHGLDFARRLMRQHRRHDGALHNRRSGVCEALGICGRPLIPG